MFAINRRFERKSSALKKLSDQGIKIDIIKDYSHFENGDIGFFKHLLILMKKELSYQLMMIFGVRLLLMLGIFYFI